ncbi:MAG: ATP-binding protein [Halomonas sp.]|uniref:ATP-binding protein n=1 Tax=Halomonas sp. TaxID=1486246 RepID=UPI0017BFEBFC|nr:ATP-binding protein [Halomonas sp.]NWN83565.1 ATP-binding protein [Halomonas sp.]
MSFLPIDRRSLRFNLLIRLGVVALLVVGVTWLLHGILLDSLAREFLGDRLRQEAHYTLGRLERLEGTSVQWLDADSLATEVFHHLYVLRVGDRTSSSHPSWLITLEPLLDGAGARLFDVEWQGRHLLVYREFFELDGDPGVLLVGEDFAPVEAGLGRLHWWVGGIAGIVLMLLIVLNLMAVRRSLRPLARLQDQLAEFQKGQRERLDLDCPSELDGLLIQLNHFMGELQRRLQRSREAVANLSHTLQTPLAAVTQVLRGRRPIDDRRRQRMLERLEGIQAQLTSELRRARFAGPDSAQHVVVAQEAATLIDMMRTLYPDKRFTLDMRLPPEHSVSVERQDLNEMLGVVFDNAGKWAREHVICRLDLGPEQALVLEVEDDGPGVPAPALSQLGERGKRLDESTPGHGLGLAILKQVVAHYRGEVTFFASVAGGLGVRIELPCK